MSQSAPLEPIWNVMAPEGSAVQKAFSEETGSRLIKAARAAKAFAYAPYSQFHVGAAALFLEKEDPFTGCNVENASYGATMCAERNAIFSGISNGGIKLAALSISLDSSKAGDELSSRSPCGICRQVISEFADENTVIYIDRGSSNDAAVLADVFGIDELLPWRFRLPGKG